MYVIPHPFAAYRNAHIGRMPLFALLDAGGFLDAAMLLVPEGWHIMKMGEGPEGIERHGGDYDGSHFACLHTREPGILHNLQWGSATSLPLALTAAACRALAAKGG